MFYSHDILARKGPLGTIWIAAHLDRKLRKNQVLETDITVSVEAILSADLQKVLALRLSGHLLLGITRIFNRKVNYLYENCETALDKLKQAYKKGNVDLPKEQAVARYEDVTLPDQYVLPDLEAFSQIYATPLLSRKNQNKNVSRPEDITIVERPMDNPFTMFNDEELPPVDDLDFAGPVDCEYFALSTCVRACLSCVLLFESEAPKALHCGKSLWGASSKHQSAYWGCFSFWRLTCIAVSPFGIVCIAS